MDIMVDKWCFSPCVCWFMVDMVGFLGINNIYKILPPYNTGVKLGIIHHIHHYHKIDEYY